MVIGENVDNQQFPFLNETSIKKQAITKLVHDNAFCMNRSNTFNPLPDDKILDWSKLKQTAYNILECI